MDNLIFERIWQNEEFFGVKITAISKSITASACVNVFPEYITKLSESLSRFPGKPKDTLFWEVGVRGFIYHPYLSLRVYCIDGLGHIKIEVRMEINDEDSPIDQHSCHFFINTETAILNEFGKRLIRLSKPIVGQLIALNDPLSF